MSSPPPPVTVAVREEERVVPVGRPSILLFSFSFFFTFVVPVRRPSISQKSFLCSFLKSPLYVLVYYTDLYPTELNHNQQLANPNTLCR
jgi:hypothetical protein